MYMSERVATLDGRPSYWPRGKVLGGSSAINAMVYVRGQAADYDGWRAAGNPGWGWDDRSEEHTSELQSLMRISYAVFCLKKKNKHCIQYQQPCNTYVDSCIDSTQTHNDTNNTGY